jgi:hypothetical protein
MLVFVRPWEQIVVSRYAICIYRVPLNQLYRLKKYQVVSQLGVKMERIISDRPTDRRLTERKNGFGRIVSGYGHGYG